MKRLRLMVLRSRKEKILRELTRLGCVELAELPDAEGEGLRRESSGLMALRTQQNAVEHAVTLLNRYAPFKSKLLSAKPEMADSVFLSDEGLESALALAGELARKDEQVRRVVAEESRQRGVIESLQPWQGLELPLECEGTERTSLVLGTVPARVAMADVTAALDEAADEAELYLVNEDKSAHYLLLLALKEPLTNLVEKKKPLVEDGVGMYAVQTFFEMFETMLSFFSNTLSFVRVGAFAVSHAAMMEVVLMLAGAENGGNINWIAVVLGNLFVCGMEGMIVGIQVLRLEYYEMFGRFYRGDGKEFRPFGKQEN